MVCARTILTTRPPNCGENSAEAHLTFKMLGAFKMLANSPIHAQVIQFAYKEEKAIAMRATSNSHKPSLLRRIRLCGSAFLFLASVSVLGDVLTGSEISELKPLPVGVTMPVQMGTTIRAGKTKAGTTFTATTTQRVPVSAETYLDRGAKLSGTVVSSTSGDGTEKNPSALVIQFTQISYRKQDVPIATGALAIASRLSINDTYFPTTATIDQFTNNPADWITRQIGGELVARTRWEGPVASGRRIVGRADYYGVYTQPTERDDMHFPMAIGIFSTTARGMYGYAEGTTLESSAGTIKITSTKRDSAVIRGGEQLLLQVIKPR
jgi:hypothetical protein